jgi:hypothetical protein
LGDGKKAESSALLKVATREHSIETKIVNKSLCFDNSVVDVTIWQLMPKIR